MKKIALAAALGFSVSTHPFAQPGRSVDSRIVQSQTQATTDAALEERQARDWGLRPEEWARYRQLMQGPLGIYSPNLDPLSALGIEARSTDEQRRYAELQVHAEARRTEKLLIYQRAYDAAWGRLYPKLLRVNPLESPRDGQARPRSASTGSGRLALFVKDGCPTCEQQAKKLQAAGTAFDLYVVGSRQDDALIRRWASQAGIEPGKVQARTITLNHDSGRWLSLGLSGELPALVREVNGQWQRQ